MTQMFLSNDKLRIVSNIIIDNFDLIIERFSLSLNRTNKMYIGCCPIHNGDNYSAINIYHDGNTNKGNWYCNTHRCEEVFQPTALGLVRGLLSQEKCNWSKCGDKTYSFSDTIKWCLDFFKIDPKTLKTSKQNEEELKFIRHTNGIYKGATAPKLKLRQIQREEVRQLLDIPSSYYLSRGYSAEILDKYDVGLCKDITKPFYNRVVFPIYDNNYEYMVGCTSRSVWEKCEICKTHHSLKQPCPAVNYQWQYTKWRHNTGFESDSWLFNYWAAKEYIKQCGIVVAVESPGNVLRLEEAEIHNGVATFGAKLSNKQKLLLDISGALTIIILTDPDKAGILALEKIVGACGKQYRIVTPKLGDSDIGAMPVQQVKDLLLPLMEKYHDNI